MKSGLHLLFCSFIITCFSTNASEPYRKNLGFENGNFNGWVGYNWILSTDLTSINTSPSVVALPNGRRQTIISDTAAYDANTGGKLKKIPSGYRYSARLGDEITNSDSNPRDWEQSLRYTMKVDSTNALLIMKFACVLQYASDHTAKMEPRFRLTLFDQKGDTINDCSNYDVYSSNSSVKGFNSYTPSGSNNPIKWRDWTTVGADLSKYKGESITIEFMAADCTGRFHYGYAYFVVDSQPLYITVDYCTGDSQATLKAPQGFETYRWTDEAGITVGNGQDLLLADPKEGAKYSCSMISATGCDVNLTSTIKRYETHASFSNKMVDCQNNEVQFTNLSTHTNGTLSYSWIFDDGGTSEEISPKYRFKTSGRHAVKLITYNLPSSCSDTMKMTIESFSPPLVGISGNDSICIGGTGNLKAYGAWYYQWSTDPTNLTDTTSTKTGLRAGKYWVVGNSTTGCHSDTIYKTISEEKDWNIKISGGTQFCTGDSISLKATGAVSYLWDTGETADSITVNLGKNYSVTGIDKWGCERTTEIAVAEIPPPDIDFTLSTTTIDKRHNTVSANIPSQENVAYLWGWGDGTSDQGLAVSHTYSLTGGEYQFNVTLTATDKNGCTNSSVQTILVTLFVPNVFTPDFDGVNDLFMAGYNQQIVDRNGIVLYKGNAGWNGTYKGQSADPDTYFYVLHYTDANQNEQIKKGYVTLVR